MKFAEMTTSDIRSVIPRNPCVLVPVGSMTQYGPHLPVGTNALLAEAIAGRLDSAPDVLVAPAVTYSYAYPRSDLPGAITVWPSLLEDLFCCILSSFTDMGLSRIVLLYAHLPVINSLNAAAQRTVAQAPGARVAVVSWWQLAGSRIAELFPGETGHHAMSIETSLLEAVAPSLVRADAIRDDRPKRPLNYDVWPAPEGVLSDSGVNGNPRLHDPESGRLLLNHISERLATLVRSPDLTIDGPGWNIL
jgi:creatinine amidohydrolase